MVSSLLKKIFGSRNDRLLKQYRKTIERINELEPQTAALSDEQLAAKTVEFRQRFEQGATLDDLLPEAFAVVREGGKRALGMRHFDVQLLGGIVLHSGRIAEMRTGEGKTLVATLPAYLNAIASKGVHVVTVNDYLASRDAEWMGRLYRFLGMSVGVIVSQQPNEQKKEAYAADITYGTNNEYGFDYLRDNMEYQLGDRRQRPLFYAIVDEVDSILIDEARTPLIISGQAEDHTELYVRMNAVPPLLTRMTSEPKPTEPEPPGDFWVDEKGNQLFLSEAGHENAEAILSRLGILPEGESLYDPRHISLMHHLMVALRGHNLFFRDQHYVVQDGEVVIVDEFTGRLMTGRRWSDGLHQAVEAKEGVKIQNENQTLASITFQNYFRMYEKLAGMTGTADTEAFEFHQIYNLAVMVIPPNKPLARKDYNDLVFLTAEEKYAAIINDIKDGMAQGRPILVGTATIETSEHVSNLLNKEGIEHKVLNAKFHEKEAEIIAQAGRPGALTIATNMAGRGTDILLGGNWEVEVASLDNPTPEQIAQIKADWQKRHQAVLESGGLQVIASERHESRRIDNQLRGRAGRQGDAGSSRFYLSLEDSLMRIFASDRVKNFMKALGMQSGEAIEHRMVTNAIEKAQRKVEGRNFDIRKQLLEFDDVNNEQRKVIYHMRNTLLAADNIGETIADFRQDVLNATVSAHIPPQSLPEQWDVAGLEAALKSDFGVDLPVQQWLDEDDHLYEETLREKLMAELLAAYNEKEEQASAEALRTFEKQIVLRVLDDLWKDHLSTMDHLRHGIHLRGYAQKNPKQEYKRESFTLFQELLDSIKRDTIRVLSHVQVRREDPEEEEARLRRDAEELAQRMQFEHAEAPGLEQPEALVEEGVEVATLPVRNDQKQGRNELCWCGSGKKYKHCHGQIN